MMVRTSAGEWDVEVFQALEDVLHAWERQRDEQTTAVLHVGFERRVARSFEHLASVHPGKVLLTPGAKGALPYSFSTSKSAIGLAGNEPVFLALEGWGYAEVEPEESIPAPTVGFEGWLKNFVTEHPQHERLLSDVGIVDDDTYREFEGSLDREIRTLLAISRSKYLVGDEGNDPTALARAAPPWLSSVNLSDLDLTVRIGNAFRKGSVSLVSDIGALTLLEMLKIPNFGRTSVDQLSDIMRRALHRGPPIDLEEQPQSGDDCLLDAVHRSLATCAERERDILLRRMGLGRRTETLAEIGESYEITRERIRQIEAKVVDRLVRREVWDNILAAKLHILLADREFPLPLIGAEALDPWFSGIAAHPDAVRYLIANMCNTSVAIVEIDGIEYISFLSQDSWDEILVTARQLLASGVDQRWTEQDCRHDVQLLLPDDAREFGSLLWERAAKWCHFAEDAETRTLIAYGRGVDQVVEALLLESEIPLHYSDIAVQAAARAGRELDERRAHNAAAEVGYLFGPGTYGMLKHVSVARPVWEALADEAAEIVLEAPIERQWHTSELIDLLVERGVALPDSFDKYQLDIVLKQVGQLHSLGRMVWSKSELGSDSARVDIRQAVITIVQNAGAPLSSAELRQRLVALRGINQGMQFQVIDPLIKLSSQIWGLNDRDLAIKRPEQPAFLESIVARLQVRMKPVHISQCADVLGEAIPSRAVFCLASLDPRLRVTQDRYLTLSEW